MTPIGLRSAIERPIEHPVMSARLKPSTCSATAELRADDLVHEDLQPSATGLRDDSHYAEASRSEKHGPEAGINL